MTDLTHRVEAIERHLGMKQEVNVDGPCPDCGTTVAFSIRPPLCPSCAKNKFASAITPTRPERSQEYKDAMVAAQKAGIPVQRKLDVEADWADAQNWGFYAWDIGDYRIDPTYQQPAKPAQRVAKECEIKMHSDGILRARYKDGGVEFTEWTHMREVLPDE
jgi:hypothetical protein